MREGGRGRCGSLARTVAAMVLVGALGTATDGTAQSPAAEAVKPPPELIVLPPDETVKLQLGERRRFSVTVTEPGAEYRWTLGDAVVGTAARWEFVPRPADLGSHVVTVTVLVGSTASRRRWRVTVTPAPPPTVRDAAPEGDVVQGEPGTTVSFRFLVEPGVPTDTIAIAWSIDGEAAGTGTHLRVEPPAAGSRRIRVVATSELGAVIVRQWELRGPPSDVAVAPAEPPLGAVAPDEELLALLEGRPVRRVTTSTAAPVRLTTSTARPAPVPATSSTSPPRVVVPTSSVPPRATTSSVPPRVVVPTSSVPARVVVTTSSVAPRLAAVPPSTVPARRPPDREPPAPVRPTPAPPAGVTRADVEALMGRYAQAFSRQDVAELRRIGQVTDDRQADALGRYFATVRELQVSVRVLSVETKGETATVRFQRRDRFRDPTGRVVDKESPPIEKSLRRMPDGLKFMPRS
jgi:hypothetical protein